VPASIEASTQIERGQEKSRKFFELAAFDLVPGAGLEPARLAAGDFESPLVFFVFVD
jgi:hypothetical protein